jgi:hypothetical protein
VEEQAFRPALLALKRLGFSPGGELPLFMKHALIFLFGFWWRIRVENAFYEEGSIGSSPERRETAMVPNITG